MFGLLGGGGGEGGGGVSLPGLSSQTASEARSLASNAGPVISGGQRNGPPWYVWAGVAFLGVLFLLKD